MVILDEWTKTLLFVAITAGFAAVARLLRGVDLSGAIAGSAVCFLLLAGGGIGAFAALVTVFALTWAATRAGRSRKQRMGLAERSDGRRASQVLANLGVAAICAGACAVIGQKALLMVAAAAALAEAAGDTVSSEVGQAASTKARLITTWQEVPAGTDGAISLMGTLAGVLASASVSVVCIISGMFSWRLAAVALGASIAGMFADSVLGAWLERRQVLNNDAVNFLSTLSAASLAVVFVALHGT